MDQLLSLVVYNVTKDNNATLNTKLLSMLAHNKEEQKEEQNTKNNDNYKSIS